MIEALYVLEIHQCIVYCGVHCVLLICQCIVYYQIFCVCVNMQMYCGMYCVLLICQRIVYYNMMYCIYVNIQMYCVLMWPPGFNSSQGEDNRELREHNGKIIECCWDFRKNQWRFLRVRTDKSFPNAYETAISESGVTIDTAPLHLILDAHMLCWKLH